MQTCRICTEFKDQYPEALITERSELWILVENILKLGSLNPCQQLGSSK